MSIPMPEIPPPPPGFKPPDDPVVQTSQYTPDHSMQSPSQFASYPNTQGNDYTQNQEWWNQVLHRQYEAAQQRQNTWQPTAHSPTMRQPAVIPPMQQYTPSFIPGPRRYQRMDWLDAKVPPDSFGLIGEILLCPFKVVLAILLAVIRKEDRPPRTRSPPQWVTQQNQGWR